MFLRIVRCELFFRLGKLPKPWFDLLDPCHYLSLPSLPDILLRVLISGTWFLKWNILLVSWGWNVFYIQSPISSKIETINGGKIFWWSMCKWWRVAFDQNLVKFYPVLPIGGDIQLRQSHIHHVFLVPRVRTCVNCPGLVWDVRL